MKWKQEERPPHNSILPGLTCSEEATRWVPPNVVQRHNVLSSTKDRNDFIFRRVRSILNKLTPEKFDKLSLELLNVGISDSDILKGIILLIFDKALEESKYSKLYAQLCHRLCEDVPNFEPPATSTSSFRHLLLRKCEDEFQNRSKATEVFVKQDGPFTEEDSEQYYLAKEKMLGNIKFIGELGKMEMLHKGILHKCIHQLLEKKKNTPVRELTKDLECLCKIMSTVGPQLDTVKAKSWMDQYFSRIETYASNQELPSRIRFMLQDVLELRCNSWKPRRVAAENGPKTINAIRQEASNGWQSEHAFMPYERKNGFNPQLKGLVDILNMPIGSMSSAIGTGPGVIQVDNFVPNYAEGRRGGKFSRGGLGRSNANQWSPGPMNDFYSADNSGSQNRQNAQAYHHQQQPLEKSAGSSQRTNIPPRFQRLAHQLNTGGTVAKTTHSKSVSQQALSLGGAPGVAVAGGSLVSSLPPHSGVLVNGKDEISLRPQGHFFTVKSNTSPSPAYHTKAVVPAAGSLSLLSKTIGETSKLSLNPTFNKQISMKPAKEEKTNQQKKQQSVTLYALKDKVSQLLSDFFSRRQVSECMSAVVELNIPQRAMPEFVAQVLLESVSRTEIEQDLVMELISALKSGRLLTCEQFVESFMRVADQMPPLEQELPLVKSIVARLGALAVVHVVVGFGDMAAPFKNGLHYPLFLLCLQSAHRVNGRQWLLSAFNDSKVNLQDMLPEIDQKNERLHDILEDRGLSFLFPLMHVQSELGRQIASDPSPSAILNWIDERVDSQLLRDTQFVNILVTSIVKYVTRESTLTITTNTTLNPEKALCERERELLDKLKAVLQRFLHDHRNLQVASLYAVQVFCCSNLFPKGMLLRFFMNMYDLEIVEEEAFFRWKEEVNDQYAGKGKALFQVNQWLTWLEHAEEESEEGE